MWGESARVSNPRKDPMTVPAHHRDASLFVDKARKFDNADESFRALVAALSAYKQAVSVVTECAVDVAQRLDSFYAPHDRQQRTVCANFLNAQQTIRDRWVNTEATRFENDVLIPINNRVDDIPKVREYIKLRDVTLTDMQRKQKKLHSERKKRSQDGARLRDKQRQLKEISDRYAMFHDMVIQRFNYMERNMGSFVTEPLRSLLSIMSDMAKVSVDSLHSVQTIMMQTQPITENVSPAPPMQSITDQQGGVMDTEKWDDFTFDDDDDDVEVDGNRIEQDENLNRDQHSSVAESSRASETLHENDLDSVSARGRASRPPAGRPRVRSADASARRPAVSLSGFESLATDLTTSRSPHAERSASSAPADPNTLLSPTLSIPATAQSMQRETTSVAGSAHGVRGSHFGVDPYFLPSVGTSAASSTSTENIGMDALRISSRMERRRRRRDGQGSGDTVGSDDKLLQNEVLIRVVSLFDYPRQESNELSLHVGDVIEVTTKNDSGWWTGQCGTSRGYFPRNYTRELTEKEELDFLAEKRRRKRRGHRRQESTDSARSGRMNPNSSM